MVAPHPDDEVLAAGALIGRTVKEGGEVHVVVATDGEAGVNRTRSADLADAREAETRQALATLGVPDGAVEFLHYADERLEIAWSERWSAARHGAPATSGASLVDALRASIRAARPDTIVVPLPLDEHPDHRAIGEFALLAILGETGRPRPRVLGYVIHGANRWPACNAFGRGVSVVPPGCAGLRHWIAVRLDHEQLAAKQAVIGRYRTQLGPTLFRYATPTETFATDVTVTANRAASPWRPAVHRDAHGIAITMPRAPCLVDATAGDRLRLRYFRAGALEERVVGLVPEPVVSGGAPGGVLGAVADVRVAVRPAAVALRLDPGSFQDVGGAVLEVMAAPGRTRGASWLLHWS